MSASSEPTGRAATGGGVLTAAELAAIAERAEEARRAVRSGYPGAAHDVQDMLSHAAALAAEREQSAEIIAGLTAKCADARDDCDRLAAEVERLRERASEAECERDHALRVLVRIGQIIGCEHVETSDCRERLVRCIGEEWNKLEQQLAAERRATGELVAAWREKANECRRKLEGPAANYEPLARAKAGVYERVANELEAALEQHSRPLASAAGPRKE